MFRLGRSHWRTYEEGIEKEWLLTNGIGGYANQTIIGACSRMHHAYLNISLNPPSDRFTVLSGTRELLRLGQEEHSLSAQEYISGIEEGYRYLSNFYLDGVPVYEYQIRDVMIKKSIVMAYGKNTVYVCYEVTGGNKEAELLITPQFTWKELGTLAEKNDLDFTCSVDGKKLLLTSAKKEEVNIYTQISEGSYYDRSQYKTSMAIPNYMIQEGCIYGIDRRNGLNGADSFYTPYDIVTTIKAHTTKQFYLCCSTEGWEMTDGFAVIESEKERKRSVIRQAKAMNPFQMKLAESADQFLVDRKSTGKKTILAGYPWFLDWGRDTMISFTGILLCTNRFLEAREVLESFIRYIRNGILPNVFPNKGNEKPGYNTIDASLWYFYAVYQYLQYTGQPEDYRFVQENLYTSMKRMIEAYEQGTDYEIGMDLDGLIKGGSRLDQLTWMDVRVGEWVVTPRHGKAVEVNALWYQALCVMEWLSKEFKEIEHSAKYNHMAKKCKTSFCMEFWNEKDNCLYDVIENKREGKIKKDSSIRPNQIYAVSLPFSLLDPEKEKLVVDCVFEHLYTPYGLRSLSRQDPRYQKKYLGKLILRDGAYHMGTAWAYLAGAFISAYCKVNGHSRESIKRAKEMCLKFEDHMQDGCLNGIAEIFDGDFACTGRGCYHQAWSVGEILRAYKEEVLRYELA